MKPLTPWWRLLLAGAGCAALCGCLNLKPAASTTRHVLLAPRPPAEHSPATASAPGVAVGLRPVKLPAYLSPRPFLVRRAAHEVEYLETAVWAERLDHGLQRVLAVNLAGLLPTAQMRLSTWRRQDVAVEVQVTVEQFEVNTAGTGTLVAWWRLTSPGGDQVLKTGETRLSQSGPPPDTALDGSVGTLSQLAAELSRQLAEACRDVLGPGGAKAGGE